MDKAKRKDRIVGAIMGTLIGDALGLGPHWYYDLGELRKDYGPWVADYADPKPGRYHAGCTAGDVSQTGQVTAMLLTSVAERGGYDQADFTNRLDEFLKTLDGTPTGGRYTDEAMRDVWKARATGKPWSRAGSFANTAEAAVRSAVLAGRYAGSLPEAVASLSANVRLTHRDPQIAGSAAGFGLVLWALMNGTPLAKVGGSLRYKMQQRELAFAMPAPCDCEVDAPAGVFIDTVLQPAWIWEAAHDPAVAIEPAQAACRLFGLACAISFQLPGAFYLASRFPEDFEMAVLSAINGGGNNMARASLTGALSGAMNGFSAIPQRFVAGLHEGERYLALAENLAEAALAAG
jgi:ADP-ribosylglycohydrolase